MSTDDLVLYKHAVSFNNVGILTNSIIVIKIDNVIKYGIVMVYDKS